LKISIIIPAYNEEKRIGRTLEKYCNFFREKAKKKKFKFEILVVLNGCKDNTLGVVKRYKRKYKEISYLNFEKAGKGFAIIEGFKSAIKNKFDLIGFTDADLATPPEAFYSLLENIGEYDGIIGSRWIKGAKIKREKILRRILSRGFNFLVRSFLFLPYQDTQCGAKLFKRRGIEKIIERIKSTRWAFDPNLLYLLKMEGFKVKEHPTTWCEEEGSKIRAVGSSVQMALAILRLRLMYSPLKFIVRAYNLLPEKIKIHHRF